MSTDPVQNTASTPVNSTTQTPPAVEKTSSTNATDTNTLNTVQVGSMEQLRQRAPEMYDLITRSLMENCYRSMQRSNERLIEEMKKHRYE